VGPHRRSIIHKRKVRGSNFHLNKRDGEGNASASEWYRPSPPNDKTYLLRSIPKLGNAGLGVRPSVSRSRRRGPYTYVGGIQSHIIYTKKSIDTVLTNEELEKKQVRPISMIKRRTIDNVSAEPKRGGHKLVRWRSRCNELKMGS